MRLKKEILKNRIKKPILNKYKKKWLLQSLNLAVLIYLL